MVAPTRSVADFSGDEGRNGPFRAILGPVTRRCPSCGFESAADLRFCGRCGHDSARDPDRQADATMAFIPFVATGPGHSAPPTFGSAPDGSSWVPSAPVEGGPASGQRPVTSPFDAPLPPHPPRVDDAGGGLRPGPDDDGTALSPTESRGSGVFALVAVAIVVVFAVAGIVLGQVTSGL